MNTLITLCKKHMMKLIMVLMLIWTVSNVFVLPQIAAAGLFCSVVVPTTLVTVGKKYSVPFAVLGVVWLVIAIIMNWT